MTVAELIEALRQMPQDAEVCYFTRDGIETVADVDHEDGQPTVYLDNADEPEREIDILAYWHSQ